MDALEEFLGPLFEEGRIIFRRKPDPVTAPSAKAIGLLERAYADSSLDIAGAAIAFDAVVAGAAAEVVRQASWALICHRDRVEDLERRLAMPHPPSTASHHLSADLVLRYLPQVHRRARALDPADALIGLIERVLRNWPLSGVLAGLDEGPSAPLDFGGHEGLMLLYAERLSGRTTPTSSPAWRPTGRALEYVELITAGAGGEGGGGRERDRDRD